MQIESSWVMALAAMTICLSSLVGCGGESTRVVATPPAPPPPTGTIQFAASAYSANEGTSVDIVVSRIDGDAGTATVDYATADRTAAAGSDYPASNGTLTWADGVAGDQTITIPVTDDRVADAPETFVITLSDVSGASLGATASATVNVGDFDQNGGNVWVTAPSLSDKRWGITSCAANDKIYLFGGAGFGTRVEEFDPATGQFTTRTPIPTSRRYGSSCVLVGDEIYLIGGYSESNVILNNVDIYNPVTDTWTIGDPMGAPRYNLSLAAIDGKIYAIGGRNGTSNTLGTVDEYTPQSGSWVRKAALPIGHHSPATVTVDGKIYAIGGINSVGASNFVYEYDPQSDSWSMMAMMPTSRTGHTSAVMNGHIYVIGGSIGADGLSIVEKYDPSTDTWETKTDMPTARGSLAASPFRNVIYVFGGRASATGSTELATVESYAPVND